MHDMYSQNRNMLMYIWGAAVHVQYSPAVFTLNFGKVKQTKGLCVLYGY